MGVYVKFTKNTMKPFVAETPKWVIPYPITKCPWVHLRFYWNLNHRMSSWTKYYLETFSFIPFGSKIITLQILLKISQNCLLSAASKIFPTLDSNNSPTKKVVRLKFGSPVAIHPSKSISSWAFLKVLSFSVKFCQKCQKMHF